MAIQIRNVADQIAGISITGIDIKDLDEIPVEVQGRDCPLIIPAPPFITNMRIERVDLSTQEQDIYYTLNYRLLSAPVGVGRGIFELYDTLVTNYGLFVDAILTNHSLTDAIDVAAITPSAFGVVTDPSGNEFFGFDMAIEIMEFK